MHIVLAARDVRHAISCLSLLLDELVATAYFIRRFCI